MQKNYVKVTLKLKLHCLRWQISWLISAIDHTSYVLSVQQTISFLQIRALVIPHLFHKHQLLRAFFKIQISYQSSSPSGFYNITTGGDTWKTYCNMGRIPGCGEGGWTLVMRINGSKVCYKINGRLDVLSACLAV